ncbi:MAG: hypothetical protein HC859_05335 [Bacteroidia bacterium]|nr:hypothetical protein [Bacteroidia bacterium]
MLICAVGTAGANTKQTPVDSLINQIGTARVSALEPLFGRLGSELRKLPPDQIKQYEEKVLDACNDDPRKRIFAYRTLSWAMETTAPPQALQYLYDAAAYARRADTTALSHALLNLGRVPPGALILHRCHRRIPGGVRHLRKNTPRLTQA